MTNHALRAALFLLAVNCGPAERPEPPGPTPATEVREDGISTRLAVLEDPPVLGKPILLRLYLINLGDETVEYRPADASFEVIGPDGRPAPVRDGGVPAIPDVALAPGGIAVVIDKFDLAAHFRLERIGRYQVRFNAGGAAPGAWAEVIVEPGEQPGFSDE